MRLLILVMSFLLFGCTENLKSKERIMQTNNKEFRYNLRILSMSYFPAFSNPIDVLIDFDDKLICVYPPQDLFNPNIAIVEPFVIKIEDVDLKKLDNFVKIFNSIDFKKTNEGYARDGLHLETLFVFSNQTLQKVSPGNMPIKKYEDLSKMILEIVLKYNKSQNNEKVIEKIKEYY
ncbi:hypothetical protein P3875_00275 [Myroides sp. JBRI-B21084]|uniref:hypothetical protein n=1 Tax=Myroides sp. JBRI-B21084 TaxID=3119977 RepID=UPI0026E16C0C|nr:hypothetical protein [Paenimyroides cloacae]WKW46551.1 hypothetical protein P3875_00275 [Paenimyroides cloacae]